MLPNVLQTINRAIKERHCLALRYGDQREIRVVEPHAIYTNDRTEVVLDAYQTRGYSSAGRPTPFWRPFRIKKITACSLLQEKFLPRTAEGFSAARLKYKNGLVAIVEQPDAAFAYPVQAVEIGPPPPPWLRRA